MSYRLDGETYQRERCRLTGAEGTQDRMTLLFPAIDLKDGQCVRLKLGDMDQATVFNDDPGDWSLSRDRRLRLGI